MSNNEYMYSKSNIFDRPQKYMYTPYEGEEFLRQYYLTRSQIVELYMPIKAIEEAELCTWIADRIPNALRQSTDIHSEEALCDLVQGLFIDGLDTGRKEILDCLVGRFEVTKRIYVTYDQNFNRKDEAFRNILNYLLLSVACINVYRISRNLRYLNCQLKLNDLLCSVHEDITQEHLPILLYVLRREQDEIAKLCRESEVMV